MSKRRVTFSKTGMAKFISHLDLLRCFERAIMRSGLPVEYSQGFNPHQKMTFALPLPVGVTSECEVVDIFFEDGKVSDKEITQKLNENLPPDIRALKTGDICRKASDIVRAEYKILLRGTSAEDVKTIKKFFSQDEVIVIKKTKKKTEKPINIMQYIKSWSIVCVEDETIMLKVVLDAGGERNLKPDIVVAELCKMCEKISADEADIHRSEILCRTEDVSVMEIFK